MLSSDASAARLSIDSPLTIRHVSSLRNDVLEFISNSDVMEIDVNSELDVDASGLQLLASAHAFALSNGKDIRLSNAANGKLLDLLERAGFLEAPTEEQKNFWMGGQS